MMSRPHFFRMNFKIVVRIKDFSNLLVKDLAIFKREIILQMPQIPNLGQFSIRILDAKFQIFKEVLFFSHSLISGFLV